MSDNDLTWTSFNPQPQRKAQETPFHFGSSGSAFTGSSGDLPGQNKFWNTTNIFFALAITVGGFLVFLLTMLNGLEKDHQSFDQKIERSETKLETISDDIKEMKYISKGIEKELADIKEKVRRK